MKYQSNLGADYMAVHVVQFNIIINYIHYNNKDNKYNTVSLIQDTSQINELVARKKDNLDHAIDSKSIYEVAI
jgi:hypothetical protein